MRRPLRSFGLTLIVALFAITLPPVGAQELPADQLERHADVVRQDNLLRSTLRPPTRKTSLGLATAQQRASCGKKTHFSSQYGPGHPKVKKLYALCRGIGL